MGEGRSVLPGRLLILFSFLSASGRVGGPTVGSVTAGSRAGRGFPPVLWGQGLAGQVVSGRLIAVVRQRSSSAAQGQVSGILMVRRRWPRMIRALVCRIR